MVSENLSFHVCVVFLPRTNVEIQVSLWLDLNIQKFSRQKFADVISKVLNWQNYVLNASYFCGYFYLYHYVNFFSRLGGLQKAP